MRIVGGTYRSRKLETPKGDKVRPTSDKVRLAIFNMLNARGLVQDAIVIDAFCGTGALGLEALSQGAKFCHFFDKDKASIALCKVNISALQEQAHSQLIFQDVTKVKENLDDDKSADLVFLDPPYNKSLIAPTIEELKNKNWLNPECYFVIETDKSEHLEIPHLEILNEKIYSETKIILAVLNF